MSAPFYSRFAKPIVVACLLALPLVLFGSAKAIESNKNRVLDWLPQSFEETQRLFWFVERFGSDEILALCWPECTLDNELVDEYVQRLKSPTETVDGLRPLFREVVSGRSVRSEMTASPLELTDATARTRMAGWILGTDRNATCVIARIDKQDDGYYNRKLACEFAQATADEMGLTDLRIAGPTADSVEIDRAGEENAGFLRWLSVLAGLALAWLSLRNLRQVITVFVTAQLATLLSLAMIYFTGSQMDAVLMTMPALIFVLTTSGAIHLTHYFCDAAKTSGDLKAAPGQAIQAGWLPCALANFTTTVGLASLVVSSVVPVSRFGLYSALGVMISLCCLLLVWPALAQLLLTHHPLPGMALPASPAASDSQAKAQAESQTRVWWEPLFQLSTRATWPVLTLVAIGFPLLLFGLTRIHTSVHLHSLLPSNSPLLKSYDYLEDRIGPLVPVEIVVQFPAVELGEKTMYQRAQLIEELRQRIAAMPTTGGTFAATTFAPEFPKKTGARQIIIRRVIGLKLMQNRKAFVERGLVKTYDGEELWRISTRVASSGDDYSTFLADLDREVDQFLAEHTADPAIAHLAGTQAKVCGAVPLIQMAQGQLLWDLVKSFVMAFVLIAITMMVLMRSFPGGMLSMIPNVFPSLIVFGYMGFAGMDVDIGAMMTASVALGIAVDDTLHFLVWYRRAMAEGVTRIVAIRRAFQQSATAMLQTSIICGFGMLPLVASPFGPVSRFAGGMIALLAAALLGDLIVLPAILASPLGRWFAVQPNSQQRPTDNEDLNQPVVPATTN